MHGFGFGPSRRRRFVAGASWSKDFTSATLPAGTSFIRASSGSFVGATGAIASAASDTPRFGYNWSGSAHVAKGLLMEGQRSNVAYPSDDLGASPWGGLNGASVTAGVFNEGTGTSNHTIYQDVVLTPGQTATLSFLVAAGTEGTIQISIAGSLITGTFYVNYNLSPGTLTIYGAGGISASITSLSATLRVITFTWLVGGTGSGRIYLSSTNNTDASGTRPSYTGTSKTFSLLRAQLEEGDYPTSFIATTGAIVTRAPDSLKGPLTTVWPLFDTTKGTIWIEGDAALAGASNRTLFSIYASANAANQYIRAYCSAGYVFFAIKAGAASASMGVARASRAFKTAMRFSATDIQLCVNAALGTPVSGITLPTGLDTIAFGCGATAGSELGGSIKRIGMAPVVTDNAGLQGLTI